MKTETFTVIAEATSTRTDSYLKNISTNLSSQDFVNLESDEIYQSEFAEILLEMSRNNSHSRTYKIEDLYNDDDFFYYRNPPANSEIFPIFILVLTLICIVSTITCLIYSKCTRKTRRHPIYSLLNHYLFFNICLSFDVCLKVLSSPIVRTSDFYIHKNNAVCTLHQFIILFVESAQSFQLMLIWLILMAERNIFPRFKFLYADHEFEKASVEQATNVRPEIAKLREKTFTSCLTRNSRQLILGGFYLVSFVLSTILSPSYVYQYKTTKLCIHAGFTETPYVLRLALYFLFFFPILYYLIALSTCFSRFFGGESDPIRDNLLPEDHDRIELVKKVTLLKCVIEFATEIHSSSYLFLSTTVYEILRISGLVAILATIILFVRYENFYSKLKKKFFGSNTNSGIGRAQAVRERRSTETVVNYTNLVENEN